MKYFSHDISKKLNEFDLCLHYKYKLHKILWLKLQEIFTIAYLYEKKNPDGAVAKKSKDIMVTEVPSLF